MTRRRSVQWYRKKRTPAALPAPAAPTFSDVTDTSAVVAWVSPDPTATASFTLERSLDQATWTTRYTGAALTLTETGLSPTTGYYYRLTVTLAGTVSTPSPVSSFTTQATPVEAPATPAVPTVGEVTETTAALSWPTVPTATSYTLRRGTTADGTGAVDVAPDTTARTFTDTGLTGGTTYYYFLVASNAAGTSPASPGALVQTAAALQAPGAPGRPVGSNATDTAATLTWPAPTSGGPAATYTLQRSTSSTTGFTTVPGAAPTGTSHIDTGLTPVTTYYYRVRANNAAGSSAYSPVSAAVTTTNAQVGNVQPMAAAEAASYVNTNTHPNFAGVYTKSVAIGTWMQHFNFRGMRGKRGSNATVNADHIKFLRDNGMKWVHLASQANGSEDDAQIRANIKWINDNAADVTVGIEGQNEPSHYMTGLTTEQWMDKTMHVQELIWTEVKKYPALSHVKVISAAMHEQEALIALGNGTNWWQMLYDRGFTDFCDVIALHTYPSQGPPEHELDNRINIIRAAWDTPAKPRPLWVTETGYSDEWAPMKVTGAGAAYGGRFPLEFAKKRIPLFQYELLDDEPSRQTGIQRVFGVVFTGTTDAVALDPANWYAKPLGTALKAVTDQWVEPAGTAAYTPTRVTCNISTTASGVMSLVTATKAQSDAGKASCFLWRRVAVGTSAVNVTVTDRIGALPAISLGATPVRVDLR